MGLYIDMKHALCACVAEVYWSLPKPPAAMFTYHTPNAHAPFTPSRQEVAFSQQVHISSEKAQFKNLQGDAARATYMVLTALHLSLWTLCTQIHHPKLVQYHFNSRIDKRPYHQERLAILFPEAPLKCGLVIALNKDQSSPQVSTSSKDQALSRFGDALTSSVDSAVSGHPESPPSRVHSLKNIGPG
jgi:hypothetical protein